MRITHSITNAIQASFSRPADPTPQAPGAESANPAVAYPYLPKTGDPKSNEYATQLQSVMKAAALEAAASRKASAAFMHQLRPSGTAAATASDPQPVPDDIDVKAVSYNRIYLEGARALEQTLQAQGMKIPTRIAKGKLSHVEDAEMRAKEIYFTDLARADNDPNVPKDRKEIKRRLGEERNLVKYRNLQNYAKTKLTADAAKLADLFEFEQRKGIHPRTAPLTPEVLQAEIEQGLWGVHMRLKPTTPEALDRFFKDNFDVTLERNERRESNAALTAAGTDSAARETAMQARFDLFMTKIPFGSKQPDDASPRNSIYNLAMDAGRELFSARQYATSSNLSAFTLRGGSAFVVRGDEGDGYEFKLSQPYGQKEGKPCHYELLFSAAGDGSRTLTLHRLLPGQDAPEIINLDVEGKTREEVLAQYFHKDDLTLLQGSDAALGAKDFADLYGRLTVHYLIENKVEDIVYQHIDAALERDFKNNHIVSVQGTGFSYNNGLYGENLSVDSRTVFMMRLFKLCEKGKLAAAGSCGFQQDLIWRQRGAITALQYVTKENYLVSPHGNDPYEADKKPTSEAVRLHTARAAEYELPWKTENIANPLALRRATPDKPVAQTRAFPLKQRNIPDEAHGKVEFEPNGDVRMNGAMSGLSEPENATSRNLWTPREYAPLSIPVAVKAPKKDPATGALREDEFDITIRPFQFMQGSTPVIASGNLVLSSAIKRGDNARVNISQTDTLEKQDLASYARLELVHELPVDWVLQDDEGRIVRDRDNNYEPVRMLEKVIVEPYTITRKVRILRMENNEPVYLDNSGTRVFLQRTDDGHPLTNDDGSFRYADASGQPAQGGATPQFEYQQQNDVQFKIAGIERWVRTPIEDKSKPGGVRTKGDMVLCTYKKIVQAGDEVDPAILEDSIYTLINCVHTQNGANTIHQDMSPAEITAHSWKPGDPVDGRNHIFVTSRDGRDSHPIAATPNLPGEHRIVEGTAIALGHGTVASLGQPHKDMLKEEGGIGANPYTLEPFGRDIDPEYAGQRQGNKEAILTGLVLEDIGTNRNTLETEGMPEARAREQARELLRNRLAEDFLRFADNRDPYLRAALTASLKGSRNKTLIEAAEILEYNGEYITRLDDAAAAMAQYVGGVQPADEVGKFAQTEILASLRALQHCATALHEFDRSGSCTAKIKFSRTGEDQQFETVSDVIKAVAATVDKIAKTAHATSIRADGFARLMQTLDSARFGLQFWEDAPRQILRNAEHLLHTAIENDSATGKQFSLDDIAHRLFEPHEEFAFGTEEYFAAKRPIVNELEIYRDSLADMTARTGKADPELARIERVLEDWRMLTKPTSTAATDNSELQVSRVGARQIGRPSAESAEDLSERLAEELRILIQTTPEEDRESIIEAAAGKLLDAGVRTAGASQTKEQLADELSRLFENGLPENRTSLFAASGMKPILAAMDGLKDIDQTPAPIEQVMQELSLLVASAPGERRQEFMASAVAQLIEAGLLTAGDGTSQSDHVTELTRLFNSQEFGGVSQLFNEVQEQSVPIRNALAALKTLEQELAANGNQEAALPGRTRFMRPYPASGRTAAPAFPALMATPAAIDGAIQLVQTVLEHLGHASEQMDLAANGVAVGLETFPGGTTIAAGIGMTKDAIFKNKRLSRMKPVYERALAEHREIETELRAIEQQLRDALAGRKSTSASSGKNALDKIMKTLHGRIDALQARMTTIDHELTRTAIDTASGASLATAGAAGLGGAVVKTAATKVAAAVTAKGLATAGADMGLVSSLGLTLLGAAQLGLNIQDYMALRELVENINGQSQANRLMKEIGLGEDSGLRRAQNIRIQELKDDQLRKIGLWATFTGGSMMLVAASSTAIATHGAAAPVAGGLFLAGGIMIAGSVFFLYVQPRKMRGRGGRAADDMTHTRGGFLTTEKRSNRLLHNLNNQVGIASNAVNKIVENSFDENDRYSSGMAKQFRNTFKTLATRGTWAFNDIHRRTLQSMLAKNPDAAVGYRFDAILHSNIQELNFARFEVEEREAEIRTIRSQVKRYANIGSTIQKLRQEINNLENGIADEAKLQAKRDALDEALELQKLAPGMLAGVGRVYAKLEPELKLARDRLAAIEDLQIRLDNFVPERGRALRDADGDSTRAQFDDLLLRFLVVHDYLPDAMSRDDMRRLAQVHQDSRSLGATTLPKLMKTTYDGRLYDGSPSQGAIPAKAKLERIQFNLDPTVYDQTIDWLKEQRIDVHDLFAKVLCSSVPDRCSAERNVVNDAYTEKLLKLLKQ